jgi:recombination protein RecA
VKKFVKKEAPKKKIGHDRSEIIARVEAIRDAVNTKMKKDVLSLLSKEAKHDIPCISTGIPQLNKIISGSASKGGFPRGRVIEIKGREASAKTSLALIALALVQASNGVGAFVDAEHTFDPRYARKLKVRVDELLYSMPEVGEEGLDTVVNLVRTKKVDAVVIDSVAALVPESELDKVGQDNRPGVQAKMMSQKLRKIVAVNNNSGPAVIFINQVRTNPMVMFGSKEYSVASGALAYYATIRLHVSRIKTHTKQHGKVNKVTGFRLRVRCVKTKLCEPFQDVYLDVLYDSGISVVDMKKKPKLKDPGEEA